MNARDYRGDGWSFHSEPQRTPDQVRSEWLECADTEAEEDLAYSIFSPVFWMVVAIFLALLAFGLLVKFGVLIDPGVMK